MSAGQAALAKWHADERQQGKEMEALRAELADAQEALAELPVLEAQLSKAELHAAAHLLRGCVRTTWASSLGDALRRWVVFAAAATEPGFPWRAAGGPSELRPSGSPVHRGATTLRDEARREEEIARREAAARREGQREGREEARREESRREEVARREGLREGREEVRREESRREEVARREGLREGREEARREVEQLRSTTSLGTMVSFGGGVLGRATTVHGAARRTARILELARVVWINPLGGGTCQRALWKWQHVAGVEARLAVLDEGRRLRHERDAATERERALKRGLTSLRDERGALQAALEAAQAEAQRAAGGGGEETSLRRALHAATSERDGLARSLRQARETLAAREGEVDAMTERERSEKRGTERTAKERQALLKELSELRTERKEASAREAAALERARLHRAAVDKVKAEREEWRAKAEAAVAEGEAERTRAEGAITRGEVISRDAAKRQARALAAAARLDGFLRCTVRREWIAGALLRWALVALGRPPSVSEEDADALMGSHRESRRLAKQLMGAREEARELGAAQQAAEGKLKAERRQALAARQERDASRAQAANAREEADEAKRKEEAAKAALSAARRELTEMRRAVNAAKEERSHGETERQMQAAASRGAQRDVALQEVGELAQELESLQFALRSPARPARWADHRTEVQRGGRSPRAAAMR